MTLYFIKKTSNKILVKRLISALFFGNEPETGLQKRRRKMGENPPSPRLCLSISVSLWVIGD